MNIHDELRHKKESFLLDSPTYRSALARKVANLSKNCVFVADSAGTVVMVSSLADEMLGVTGGSSLDELFPDLLVMLTRVHEEQKECHLQSLKYGFKEFRVTANPIQLEGKQPGCVFLFEESTGLQRIAWENSYLRHFTRELETIINSSSDGLFVCDAEANVIRVNPASERIHRMAASELIGKNMEDLIAQGFIDQSAALEAIRSRGTVSLLQEKDDRKMISIGTPVFDENDNLISVVVSERDITEIDALHRELEDQGSLKDQLQFQLLEMQLAELTATQIIARSTVMIRVLEKALKVSTANSTVLITGESGVGKGLITNLIHSNSNRAGKPLIRINCGAIPESLVESELFGYESGAFTGAKEGGKPGSLELADGGSLFLDEIGELPLAAQVKLLRFLENGKITRVGGSKVISIDARILVATHRNLQEMVAAGSFRQDLYYRLSVIPLRIPPLRERKECIFSLIHHFVEHFAEISKTRKRVSREALDVLLSYPYPGNVRELMNICEHAIVMSETEVINTSDLPRDVREFVSAHPLRETGWLKGMSLKQILENVEQEVMLEAMDIYKSQAAAAKALGVSQPTIARRLKKYKKKEV